MSSLPEVGWIGLGAMGAGMAMSLASQGFKVKAYDVYPPSLAKVVAAGAIPCTKPEDAAMGVKVLGLMVVNAYQVEELLFGASNIAELLDDEASVIVFSTVPPSYLKSVTERLAKSGKSIGLCDSPVSGGSTRAANGTLSIMTAALPKALKVARPVLDALTQEPEGKLTVVGERAGQASDYKMINQVLCAIQICVTGESMAFAKALGLNIRRTLNIIQQASGASFMLGHRVPWQLRNDGIPKSAMTIIAKDVGIVMDESRLATFPAPLCSVAEQVFTAAIGAGMGREDDGRIVKMWEQYGVPRVEEQGTEEEELKNAQELVVQGSGKVGKVLVVGLGVMGRGMATSIAKAGVDVIGYDLNPQAVREYEVSGGKSTGDLLDAAKGADVVVFMTNTASQAEDVLFGGASGEGISAVLPDEAVVVLSSTVAPAQAIALAKRLEGLDKKISLVDAPVAGGPVRAAKGDLCLMISGPMSGLSKAYPILAALATAGGNHANLHFIGSEVGLGSKTKAVNQLLAGIHLCAAAEAMTFAKHKGMDLDSVFDVVSRGAAASYMLSDRVPRMRQKNAPVHSATETFVKDLGIVLGEAKVVGCPVWLAAAAHQQFVRALAAGHGKEDDSSLGKLWKDIGVDLTS